MRLEGQMHEITVALPDGPIADATMPAHPCGFRHCLCRTLYVGICRRGRHGGIVPRALPRPRCRSCH